MTNTTTLSGKFKALFSKYNRGVCDVRVDGGKVAVLVSSRKTAIGIIRDMGMSMAFSKIAPEQGQGGIWIVGTVKA